MARLVHNAVLMVACLWAPNHLHWPSDPLSRAGTNPQLVAALRIHEGEDIFVFLADCTEIIAQGSSHLILHSYTYSFKLEHVHSLKLLLVCSTLGLILWRAALYGGSTAEITPLESFIASPEFKSLTDRQTGRRVHIIGMTDRGFSRLPAHLKAKFHLLHPDLLAGAAQFSEVHAAWKQVLLCISAVYLLSIQWQQGLRARVEITNRFVKLHRAFTHSGSPHAALWQMEYFVDIMCALANVHHFWRSAQGHSLVIDIPDLHVHLARMRHFVQLFLRSASSLDLELYPKQPTQPSSDRLDAWQCVLDSLPHTQDVNDAINRVLTLRAEALLHRTPADKYGDNLINYERIKWTHTFPDERAKQLCLSHYVLLLEFCIESLPDCSHHIYVQAAVHPSQRNYLLHYARISYRNLATPPRPEAFELHSSGCSCEDGYVGFICGAAKQAFLGRVGFAHMCKHCSSRSTQPSAIRLL